MTTMTISPMQSDYVTKQEFRLFENKLERRLFGIDNTIKEMREEIKGDMQEMQSDYKRYLGMLREGFRDDLKAALDYVQAIDEKKVDKRDFEELKKEIQIRFFKK